MHNPSLPVVARPRPAVLHDLRRTLPGLGLCLMLAGAAFGLRGLTGVTALSPLVLALVLGLILRNLFGQSRAAAPGIRFSMRRLLRGAIVLLGFQLTFADLAEIGLHGLFLLAITLAATALFTLRVGKWLGVPPELTALIAAGTSVCGASAVLATNAVTQGSDEDVTYAVACVTVFGTLSMLLMPVLGGLLGMGPAAFGLWAGATIHEVAQVVAASFQFGEVAGHAGTVAKLSRVLLLAPFVLAMGYAAARRRGGVVARGATPLPLFVLGFAAAVCLNSLFPLPQRLGLDLAQGTSFLLTMALGAMGLETDLVKLRAKGFRPFALGAMAWLFISAFGLILVLWG